MEQTVLVVNNAVCLYVFRQKLADLTSSNAALSSENQRLKSLVDLAGEKLGRGRRDGREGEEGGLKGLSQRREEGREIGKGKFKVGIGTKRGKI